VMIPLRMQVTLALQPLFKRSVRFVTRDESDLADQVAAWGGLHEFGDIRWLPHQRKVIYREDNRVDVSSPGNGLNDFPAFWSLPAHEIVAARVEGTRRRPHLSRQPDVHSLLSKF
jgi:hypothetical protein